MNGYNEETECRKTLYYNEIKDINEEKVIFSEKLEDYNERTRNDWIKDLINMKKLDINKLIKGNYLPKHIVNNKNKKY